MLFSILTALLGAATVQAETEADTAGNIAYRRPYQLYPPPNYRHCTDQGDDIQLTDQQHAKGKHIWVEQPTVGWSLHGTAFKYVLISIDLGAVRDIGGIKFNTVGGAAGVQWPQRIELFASADGETFSAIGDLLELNENPAPTGHAVYAYETHKLAASGRYVLLKITPDKRVGQYVITDEIEVYDAPGRPVHVADASHTFAQLKSTNLVVNPGFEDAPADADDKADGWLGRFALSDDSRGGYRAIRLAKPRNAADSSPFHVEPETAYRISFFQKGTPCRATVRQFDASGSEILAQTTSVLPTEQWRQTSIRLRTERTTSTIGLRFDLGDAHGDAYFDDVAVSALSYAESNESYDRLTNQLVSDHIPWARPYHQGPMRALVIAPTWTHRETVELEQRLAVECTPMMCYSPGRIQHTGYLDAKPKRVFDDLDGRLALDWPLIVIGNMSWPALSERIEQTLREKIHAGTGLVYVTPNAATLEPLLAGFTPASTSFTHGVPFAGLDAVGPDAVKAYTYGKGRVVVLEYPVASHYQSLTPAITYHDRANRLHEYYLSLVAKACLWAAQREPQITIAPVELIRSDRSSSRVAAIDFDITSSMPASEYTVETAIHDAWGDTVHSSRKTADFHSGDNALSLELPLLPVGEYFYSLWIKLDNRTVNWASVALRVEDSVFIDDIQLAESSIGRNDPLRATVAINGTLTPDHFLTVNVFDNHARLIHRERRDAISGSLDLTLDLPEPLTVLHVLQCELYDQRGSVHKQQAEFVRFNDKPVTQFFFAGWSSLNRGYVALLLFEQMRRMGFDIVQGADRGEWFRHELVPDFAHLKCVVALRANFSRLFPYGWHVSPGRAVGSDPEGIVAAQGTGLPMCVKCVTSDDYLAKYQGRLEQNMAVLKHYFRPAIYSLGDECTLELGSKDICFSPSCMKDFQDWAKRKYGTIEHANGVWDTDFATWSDARGITLAEARQIGNYARWIDHRNHMQDVFATAVGRGRDFVEGVQPAAVVGIEGCIPTAYPPTFTGYHWPNLMQAVDFVIPYGGLEQEFVRSFAPDTVLTGAITGSYFGTTEAKQRIKPWDALLHGGKGMLWWTVAPSVANGGASAFSPDLDALPWLRHATQEINDIRRGIDKLIFASTRNDDPIAIHYSNLSIHANVIDDAYDHWKASLDNITAILGDVGLQYRFLATEQIEAGALNTGKYKVLILPRSKIITEAEDQAMTQFVAQGGLVLADGNPGDKDQHGNQQVPGRFASRFLEFSDQSTNATCLITTIVADYVSQSATESVPTPDSVVTKRGGANERLRLLAILKNKGIAPRLTITDSHGTRVADVEVCYYTNQGVELFGLLPHPDLFADRQSCVLQFPHAGVIYDVRSGSCLGRTDRIEVEIRKGRAKLYALVKDKITGLHVNLAGEIHAPGEVVRITAELIPAGITDALSIDILNPSGEHLPYLTQTAVANGPVTFTIPLALNQQPGTYKAVLRDVIAGVTVERTLMVGEPAKLR
jgi:hypothetical protein